MHYDLLSRPVRCSLMVELPAYQVQAPGFNTQHHKKKKKTQVNVEFLAIGHHMANSITVNHYFLIYLIISFP
jgi:hypothetical protein